MKFRKYLRFVVVSAAVCAATGSAGAAITAAQGSLLLGFAKVSGDGTGYTGNTYVYNLGLAGTYRDGSAPAVLDNLNADLTTAFGPGWADDSTVRWGILGVIGATSLTVNGDPARTTYFSLNYQGSPGGSDPVSFTSNQRGSLTNNLEAFFSSMNGAAENGAVDGGAFFPSNGINSFSSFLPPGPSTSFGVGISPVTSLDGAEQSGVDLYRTLHTTNGAQLTAANDGPATVGNGQYIGSFVLSDNGNISYVPEPTATLLAGAALMTGLTRRRRYADSRNS